MYFGAMYFRERMEKEIVINFDIMFLKMSFFILYFLIIFISLSKIVDGNPHKFVLNYNIFKFILKYFAYRIIYMIYQSHFLIRIYIK